MLRQEQVIKLLKRIKDDTENNRIQTAEDVIKKMIGELSNSVISRWKAGLKWKVLSLSL